MMKYWKLLLRTAIGIVFIFSAIAKLKGIDQFEIYIYSFDLFSYQFTTIASRAIILFEMLLGLFLIFKIKYKITWWGTLLTLIGFSFLLLYVVLFRNDDNCQCFGSLVEVEPLDSIYKNIVFAIIMFFIREENSTEAKWQKILMYTFPALTFIITFFVFPSDSLYSRFVSPDQTINVESFHKIEQDSAVQTLSILEGKRMVAFYVSGCKFCELSMKKIDQIFINNNIDKSLYNIVLAGGEDAVSRFVDKTEIDGYSVVKVDKSLTGTFLETVQGRFPTIFFLDNGKIIKAVDFRGLEDKEIISFLE